MEIRGFYEKMMFIFVLFLFLIVSILFFSACCCHTGTVIFKGYSPSKLVYGYKPIRGGPSIQRSIIYQSEFNYALIKKDNETYVRVKISPSEKIEVGDEIKKWTLYYDTLSLPVCKTIEEYVTRK